MLSRCSQKHIVKTKTKYKIPNNIFYNSIFFISQYIYIEIDSRTITLPYKQDLIALPCDR